MVDSLNNMSSEQDVLVVIVLYYPNLDVIRSNLDTIEHELSQVLFCDNTDNINEKVVVKKICDEYGCIYKDMRGNRGIASAQNKGIEYANKYSYDYVLFFDQDTIIEKDFTKTIVCEYLRSITDGFKPACIGPQVINIRDKSHYYSDFNPEVNRFVVKQIMSSGSLIPVNLLNEVGLFDSEMFIDLVDYEWCWRATAKGYHIVQTNNAHIYHSLGDGHKKIFGLKVGISAPIRHYYTYRNAMMMMRRSYVPLNWKFKAVFKLILKIPIYFLFLGSGFERLGFIYKGFRDFMRNQSGSIDYEK